MFLPKFGHSLDRIYTVARNERATLHCQWEHTNLFPLIKQKNLLFKHLLCGLIKLKTKIITLQQIF